MAKIVWKDLPKSYGLFTRRSALMITLDTKKMVQQYAMNTKLNVVQYTVFNEGLYFRTSTAKTKGLNWAIKSDAFTLPPELASLAPTPISPKKNAPNPKPVSRKTGTHQKQKSARKVATPKSEEVVAPKKANIFSKLFNKLRRK